MCSTSRLAFFRFCRACGFDYEPLHWAPTRAPFFTFRGIPGRVASSAASRIGRASRVGGLPPAALSVAVLMLAVIAGALGAVLGR